MEEVLLFYAVRNKEGKWFHRKGYGGYGETWANEIRKARIYNKIGPARAVVSFFADKYPSYGIPDLVEFKVIESRVISEKNRIADKNAKADKRAGIQRLDRAMAAKAQADKEFQEAVNNFRKHK